MSGLATGCVSSHPPAPLASRGKHNLSKHQAAGPFLPLYSGTRGGRRRCMNRETGLVESDVSEERADEKPAGAGCSRRRLGRAAIGWPPRGPTFFPWAGQTPNTASANYPLSPLFVAAFCVSCPRASSVAVPCVVPSLHSKSYHWVNALLDTPPKNRFHPVCLRRFDFLLSPTFPPPVLASTASPASSIPRSPSINRYRVCSRSPDPP